MNKYSELIEELIELKDELKEIGFNWQKYQCINDACNALEEEGERSKPVPPVGVDFDTKACQRCGKVVTFWEGYCHNCGQYLGERND